MIIHITAGQQVCGAPAVRPAAGGRVTWVLLCSVCILCYNAHRICVVTVGFPPAPGRGCGSEVAGGGLEWWLTSWRISGTV